MHVTDSKLSVVLSLAGRMWHVTCECGAEAVHKSQEAAYVWLVEHPCLLDLPAEN